MAEIVITQGFAGPAVVAPGDRVRVELPENPTTGYRWELLPAPGAALAPVSDDYQAAPGGAVGGGGQRVLVFSAASPGEVLLRLELKRAWEAAPPRDAFTAKITIR